MSGDPEQEYLTDDITEDNITELARMTSVLMIRLRAFDLAFQVCKKIGPRFRMLPFSEFSFMCEVKHGVSHFVPVVSLNFVNGPKCVPIAFTQADVRAAHRHLVLRKAQRLRPLPHVVRKPPPRRVHLVLQSAARQNHDRIGLGVLDLD
jgi:hypothetical protein